MRTEKEKDIDRELRMWFKDLPLEEPSPEFTSGVLRRIELSAVNNGVKFTPVFSQMTWLIISLTSVGLLALGYTSGLKYFEISSGLNPSNFLTDLNTGKYMPELPHTDILLYAVLALLLCFGVQVYWFRNKWIKMSILT